MRTKLLYIFFVLSISAISLGQQIPETITLNNVLTGTQDKVASSWIQLNPGFSYSGSAGSYFLARAGQKYIYADGGDIVGGPEGAIGDLVGTNGVVGAIGGNFSVSNTGAATYTIPFECPSGINGMTPIASLMYNSQAGNGIAGWGWSISGLSAITRSPKSYYYDDITDGINWNSKDNFSFDGKRLFIFQKYPSGSNESTADSIDYNLDSDPTTKVRGYGYTSFGPTRFKVWSQGKIFEYKKNQTVSNEVGTKTYGTFLSYPDDFFEDSVKTDVSFSKDIAWYLTSAIDNFGNRIKYDYEYDSILVSSSPEKFYYNISDVNRQYPLPESELFEGRRYYYTDNDTRRRVFKNFRIKEISYAGNIYKLSFCYEDRKDKINGYLNGEILLNEKRLSSVSVLHQSGSQIKTYILEYIKDSLEIYSKLHKVNLSGLNGEKYNSTVFEMEKTEYSYFKSGEYSFYSTPAQIERSESGWSYANAINYPADFNGDGISDFFRRDSYTKGEAIEDDWAAYINTGTVTTLSNSGYGSLPSNRLFYLFDRNRNGKTEIYLQYQYAEYANYQDSIMGIGYDYAMFQGYEYNGSTVARDESLDFKIMLVDQTTAENVVLVHADLDGDGSEEYILLNTNLEYVNNIGLDLSRIPIFGHWLRYFFCDFNGNGRQEIVLENEQGIAFFEYLPETRQIELIYSTGSFNSTDNFYPGDFNGDGNCDILIYDSDCKEWKKLFSTGNSVTTITIQKPILDRPEYSWDFTVGDFNQDGKSDILEISDYPAKTMNIYISDGTEFILALTQSNVPSENTLYSGEFNNDLTTDFSVLAQHPFYWSISKGKGFNQINRIFTGDGQEIDFEYARSFSMKGMAMTVVVSDEQIPKTLTAPVLFKTVSSSRVGNNSFTYEYSSPVLCNKGSWFMGFANVKKSAQQGTRKLNQVNTYRAFLYINDRYSFLPDSTFTYISENAASYPVSYSSNHYRQLTFSTSYPYTYYLVPDYTLSYDNLNDVKVKKTITGYDKYLFPGIIKTEYFAGTMKEAETIDSLTYNHTTENGVWRIGELSEKRTLMKRTAEIDYRRKWNYEYNINGSLKSEYLEKGALKELKKSYEYDIYGNVTKASLVSANDANDCRVRESTVNYSADGRFMESRIDALGNEESYTYNLNTGTLASKKDANNLSTKYTYDGFNRLRKTIFPDNNESSAVLCWAGENEDAPEGASYYTYQKFPGDSPFTVFYDKYGKELRSVTIGLSGNKIYVDSQHDILERLSKQSQPYFYVEVPLWKIFKYDRYSRVDSVSSPDGTNLIYTFGVRQICTKIQAGNETQMNSKILNSLGEVTQSVDNGSNTVTTRYYASGLPKEIEISGQTAKVCFGYDIYGNRTALTDPDAGSVNSVYNSLGYLVSQTNSNGIISSYTYDIAGRVLTESSGGTTSTFVYDTKFKGAITSASNGQNTVSNEYDEYGRILSNTETLANPSGNKTIITSFTYDDYGRTKTKDWSTGYCVTYDYNTYGNLTKISNGGTTIWNAVSQNALGQFTGYTQGQYATTANYNAYGELGQVTTPGIRDVAIIYNCLKSIESREDLVSNQKEVFVYDNLNRLTDIHYYHNNIYLPESDKGISYDYTGNITGKTGIADSILYGENNSGPHALTTIWNQPSYKPLNQKITYTDFDKVSTITDTLTDGSTKKIEFTYGVDRQRRKSVYTDDSGTVTKYYFGDYEEENRGTSVKKYFYLNSPTGLVGVLVSDGSGCDTLHYVFTDHLGSITEVVNATSGTVTRQSFDPWGNSRSASDWLNPSARSLFADRGFTGHEHLEAFALINMNGRMYDPALGRFLSPDPYVQMPDFSQNFNRYSYCLNNPLIYTDPTGEVFGVDDVIFSAIIGAMINVATQTMSGNMHSFGDFWLSAGVGFLSGAAGGAAGQLVGGAINVGGFAGGALSGAAGGAAGGFVSGSGNAWINGASFGDGLQSGFISCGKGAFVGALFGGVIRGFSDLKKGYSFWDGTKIDGMSTGLSSNEELADNYNKSITAEANDAVLKDEMAKNFYIAEGDYGIRDITTKTSRGQGLTTSGRYITLKTRNVIAAYCVHSTAGWSEIHVSPYYIRLADNVTFRAVAGHELIHAFHYYILPHCSTIFTERVAYRYSYDVFWNNGYFREAFNTMQTASKYLFWGSAPSQYLVPTEVL